MIGFLNERSLDQYGNWGTSLQMFLEAAQKLSGMSSLFKDSRFFYRPDVIQRFNSLAFPKDQHALMRELIFGNRYYRCWTQTRFSTETENYACADPILDIVDQSLSEAAERKLLQPAEAVSVLSAPDSAFRDKRSMNILKQSSGQAVELRNATSIAMVMEWIVAERGYYDRNSQSAPRDFQTVLVKDTGRFRTTSRVERRSSRRIFEEIATGRLYYVDEAHPGHSTHLEVFSASREHLGIADIDDGELDAAGRVEGRVLKL